LNVDLQQPLGAFVELLPDLFAAHQVKQVD